MIARPTKCMDIRILVTMGAMTALNKTTQAKQALRASQGLDPLVRPVAAGNNLTKSVFRILKNSEAGVRAHKTLRPIEASMGIKNGPQMIAYLTEAQLLEAEAILR